MVIKKPDGKMRRPKHGNNVEEVPFPTGLSEQTYLWMTDAGEAENH